MLVANWIYNLTHISVTVSNKLLSWEESEETQVHKVTRDIKIRTRKEWVHHNAERKYRPYLQKDSAYDCF